MHRMTASASHAYQRIRLLTYRKLIVSNPANEVSEGRVGSLGMSQEKDDNHLSCELCSGSMRLVGTIPKFGIIPELRTFRCEACGHVDTFEHNRD